MESEKCTFFCQLATVTTGGPTAPRGASVGTRHCAIPSPEPVSVPLGTEAGAARSRVKLEPMATDASKNVNARTEPPVTM